MHAVLSVSAEGDSHEDHALAGVAQPTVEVIRLLNGGGDSLRLHTVDVLALLGRKAHREAIAERLRAAAGVLHP